MSDNGVRELPLGWAEATIDDTGDYINGLGFKESDWGDEGLPIIRIQNLTDPKRPFNRTTRKVSQVYVIQDGDILVSWSATLDAFLWRGETSVLNQHIFKVVPDQRLVSKEFLFYLLRHAIAAMKKTAHLHGSTMKHINRGPFLGFPIPLAPLPEQHRIVAEIEKHFTRLDAAVAALKRVRANLKRYRASVLKAACEGRLVPTEAELAQAEGRDYEPADLLLQRILTERRAKWEADELARMQAKGKPPRDDRWKAKYKEPEPPETSDLPELPEGWVWATVEQLASPEPRSIQSGPFGSELLHSEFQDSGVLVVGIDNVLDGAFSMGRQHRISLTKYQRLERFTARPLDVLVTVMATIGRCCVVPLDLETAIITKHVYRISPNPSLIDAYYLMHSLRGGTHVRKQLYSQVKGQTRPGINGEILRCVAIPVPPHAEQQRIVVEVERRLSVIDGMGAQVEANLKRAEHLRQAILKRAFEGKLVPQDPDDEPASVLLERIRAERETAAAKSNGRRKRVATNGKRKEKPGGMRPLFEVGEPV